MLVKASDGAAAADAVREGGLELYDNEDLCS